MQYLPSCSVNKDYNLIERGPKLDEMNLNELNPNNILMSLNH